MEQSQSLYEQLMDSGVQKEDCLSHDGPERRDTYWPKGKKSDTSDEIRLGISTWPTAHSEDGSPSVCLTAAFPIPCSAAEGKSHHDRDSLEIK
ncbi:TPA: hypothetical protein BOS_10022 [Bos taurus]|nr:TPA: hypothetical protein BOS_10022 [Bos taurus]